METQWEVSVSASKSTLSLTEIISPGVLPGKPLWQFSQAVQWVEVWALAISRQRLTVKLDPVYRLNGRLVQVTDGETWRKTLQTVQRYHNHVIYQNVFIKQPERPLTRLCGGGRGSGP